MYWCLPFYAGVRLHYIHLSLTMHRCLSRTVPSCDRYKQLEADGDEDDADLVEQVSAQLSEQGQRWNTWPLCCAAVVLVVVTIVFGPVYVY
jgi:hypothetical protein